MPRVAQASRTNSSRSNSRAASASLSQSPFKNSPVKIPLNDDAQEKAQRLQSRQAAHEAQINQLKAAAATPTLRKVSAMRLEEGGGGGGDYASAASSPTAVLGSASPRTPRSGRPPRLSGVGGRSSSSGKELAQLMQRRRQKQPKGGDVQSGDDEDDDDGPVVVGGSVVTTPLKRVPLLANFEEWMKMATDNKINAANSWNFALIDYFHDMSLLKEGDGVNFQKASCTLDGCVKIYTSRVDSVATETGKLLSGLADSREKKRRGDGDGENSDNSDADDDELDEDGNARKKTKKKQRSEATLAPSFAALQLKKLELEFTVDPLFKKASADFDEGGAKGLLLNHLMIDAQGRIVFDSSDDTNDVASRRDKKAAVSSGDQEHGQTQREDDDEEEGQDEGDATDAADAADAADDVPIDVAALGSRFFADLGRLDELDVCPSLKTFELGDPSGALDIPFLRDQHGSGEDDDGSGGGKSSLFIDEDNPLGLDDTDALGFDLGPDIDFGEGGEAWAREARLDPQMRVYAAGDGGLDVADDLLLLGGPGGHGAGGASGDGPGGPGSDPDAGADYTLGLAHGAQQQLQADRMHDNILSYFDQALRKNWASAEHWRIRKIKAGGEGAAGSLLASGGRARKEKEPFAIDFAAPLDAALAELLYTEAASQVAITLPKKDWKAKSRNLLPDDKHFHSKQLLSLFLKPRARLRRRRQYASRPAFGFGGAAAQRLDDAHEHVRDGDMDEAFWAAQKGPMPSVEGGDALAGAGDVTGAAGDYHADFFTDDGLPFAARDDDDDGDGDLDAEEFADARDHFSPGADGGTAAAAAGGPGGFTAGFTTSGGFTAMTGFGGLTVTNPADLAFGTTLVTSSRRVRPEYVQYARRAKKVDVRRLKEELWRGMPWEGGGGKDGQGDAAVSRLLTPPPGDVDCPPEPAPARDDTPLKFTQVMNGLRGVYPKPVMDDISTSFCFICLLHLANEKGLVIEKTPELTELEIRRDWTAEIAAE